MARVRFLSLSKQLQAQHPDAAASVLEGLDEMFTINAQGVTGELARCLATTNIIIIIESSNSVVRRLSGRVTQYKDADMAMRWTSPGFLEAEKSFRRVRGHSQIKDLIKTLRPQKSELEVARSNPSHRLKPSTRFGTPPLCPYFTC